MAPGAEARARAFAAAGMGAAGDAGGGQSARRRCAPPPFPPDPFSLPPPLVLLPPSSPEAAFGSVRMCGLNAGGDLTAGVDPGGAGCWRSRRR